MNKRAFGILGAVVLVLSGCGSSDDSEGASDNGGEDRQAVIDWMLGQGETQESADCFADELEGYTAEDFEAFDASDTAEDTPEGMAEDVLAAAGKCADL
ncbi:MAG: hypothetical protein GY773_25315 [Actinomycetia bacterium]|nr:hypothetical protein [Actinomycetes bacterium]